MNDNMNLTKAQKKLYPALIGYDENGKPIFKKKVKEINIVNKRFSGEKIVFGAMFAFFALHALTLILPFVWMFMSSFKSGTEYFLQTDPFSFPETWHFDNYITAFSKLVVDYGGKRTNFLGMIFNGLWYSGLKTSLYVMVPAICGYVMCKFKFWGREILFAYVVFMMTFPVYGSGAAYMKLMHTLNLHDNPLYVVFTGLYGLGMTMIIYNSYFKGISNSYAESAKIDGANAFQILFKIVLPQASPLLLTYAITGFISTWNTYEDILLYLPSYANIATGLSMFEETSAALMNKPLYYAGIIISCIPSLILFSVFSSKIMTSMSAGGLKG